MRTRTRVLGEVEGSEVARIQVDLRRVATRTPADGRVVREILAEQLASPESHGPMCASPQGVPPMCEAEFHRTRMGRQFFERTLPELVLQVERLADVAETVAARAVHSTGSQPTDRDASAFQPGSRVVIRFNPHQEDASDIVGDVVDYKAGAGFMGCDLAYVRYQHPRNGEVQELPFSTANLEVGDRDGLLARAARHDEQAAKLRAMADEVGR